MNSHTEYRSTKITILQIGMLDYMQENDDSEYWLYFMSSMDLLLCPCIIFYSKLDWIELTLCENTKTD